MKRKIFNVLFVLVLLLGMSLVMAAPAAATVSQPTVTVTVPAPATVSNYSIVFTTTVAMTTAAGDTITIEFPTGTTADTLIASVVAGDVTVNTVAVTSVAKVGTRLSITPSAGVAAGTVTVAITNTHITNPNPEGIAYTLKVYTSQEPTAVTSAAYIIDSVISACTVANDPTAVDTVSAYTITPTLVTALTLAAADTITITFPATTTVPTSITSAAYVTVNGVALASTSAYSASGQTVTLTVPADVSIGAKAIVFLVGAAIKNPTSIATDWTVSIYTSQDRAVKTSSTYSTTAATQAKITQIAWKTTDAYIPLNTASSAFVIETRDVNGIAATVTADNTFSLGAGGGTFYSDSGCTAAIGTILIANGASVSASFYYKNATAGTKTLTATELTVHTPVWTAASTTVIVNPALALWGGGELKASYATFALAIAAALPYDTIKVAASTYESGTIGVHAVHDLTIQSVSGAETTIITGAAGTNKLFEIGGATGDTADGFVLDGFTLNGTYEYGVYMYVRGFDIKNNIITNTRSDGIFVTNPTTGPPVDINSGSITNNTITGKGADILNLYRPGILLEANDAAGATIHGITISNNTVSGFGTITVGEEAAGIRCASVQGMGVVHDITITGNTLTGNRIGLHIYGACTGLDISGNTMSSNKEGVVVCNSGTTAVSSTFDLVNNTIINNTVYGVRILKTADESLSGAKNIMYNDITGNGIGIQNDFTAGTAPVATHNYWGSATGPLAALNPSGAGNAVSAYVTYSPWLYNAQATVIASGKSQYAISVLLSNAATLSGSTYSGGWNTFSTPISLDSSADTWSEIKILAVATANVSSAYAWNGITWATPSDITPLNAIFVQLTPGSSISLPILYGTTLLPAATRSLYATAGSYTGWEFISLAKLAAQAQNTTLASIISKYSQVIDPISGNVIAVGTDMAVGAGYWVFMTADGTLAGFSVTPVTFVPVP